jgi:hypothetical protein
MARVCCCCRRPPPPLHGTHRDGGDEDDAQVARRARGVQHVARALLRGAQQALQLRLRPHLVPPRRQRQVDDGVAAGHERAHRVRVQHVARGVLKGEVRDARRVARRPHQAARRVARGAQRGHHVAADEAGAASHRHAHRSVGAASAGGAPSARTMARV